MAQPNSQNEVDEMTERLGDLWSMSQKEQDRFSGRLLAATIGFVQEFACAFCFVVFR